MLKEAPRARTGVAIIIVAVILGGSALAWAVLAARSAVRTQVVADHLRHARVASAAVHAEVKGDLALLEIISKRRVLTESATQEKWAETAYHLVDLLTVNPAFGSAAIFDRNGVIRARNPADPSILGRDFSHRDYYQGVVRTGRPYVSNVFVQAGIPRFKVVAYAAPIRNPSGQPVAFIQATLPVSRFDFASRLEAPESGSMQVFDQSGLQVMRVGGTGEGSFEGTPALKNALNGMSGAVEMVLPGSPGQRLTGYAPVGSLDWAVLVESPVHIAFEDVNDLTWRLGAVLGLVLLGAVGAMLAINRLMRRHDRLRREASAIVASMGDAVLVTDSDWNVLWVNPALEKLVGWTSAELRGRPVAQTFLLFDERGDRADFSDSSKLTVEDKEGSRVPVQITTAPLLDENGGMLGQVVVTRDVSREREIDSLKSNLVSTVSHELRTPLTMIKGFSELLLTKDLSQERFEKALVEINNSADRLSRLIDDLLSVSRIESGRLGLDLEDVNIKNVMEELIGSFSERENRSFLVEADDLTVRGDEDKVVQILTNLLSNAVKYSHDGSTVRITAQRSEGSAEIAVTDEGIGITDSDAQMVFEKFGRVERPEVRQAGGTGLGLYITKSLVEAHGGQIWVEPGPGEVGSRFAFTLPLSEKEAMVK